MENRKISAPYVALPDGLVRNCIVEVDQNGIITNIEREVKDMDARRHLEYFDGILTAGMINCHCHLEYSYVKGMIAKGGGMAKFISSIIDIKYNRPITEKEKIDAAAKWDDVMFKNGISAVGDHNNNDYVTDIKLKSNIFYQTFVELYDADNQEATVTFAEGERRASEQRARGLSASVVPHATYTLSDDLIALIGSEKNKGIISTHFKETIELGGENEAERMIGLIDEKHDSILFVHDIYATDEQIKTAKNKYGDRLTVVPCPLSNDYIEGRLADYDMLQQNGVRIAIGTDGLSSNEKLSILEEMKCISKQYPNYTLNTLINWATRNGAEALCINDWAGTIEVGKRPGLVVIENVDFKSMKLTDMSTVKRIV